MSETWHGLPRRVWSLVWLLSFFVVALILVAATNPWHAVALAMNAAQTEGTIQEVIPQSHNSVRVAYVVGGVRYSTVNAYDPVPATSEAFVGERVTVWFDRRSPGDSTLIEPWRGLGEGLSTIVVVGALVATFAALLFAAPGRR